MYNCSFIKWPFLDWVARWMPPSPLLVVLYNKQMKKRHKKKEQNGELKIILEEIFFFCGWPSFEDIMALRIIFEEMQTLLQCTAVHAFLTPSPAQLKWPSFEKFQEFRRLSVSNFLIISIQPQLIISQNPPMKYSLIISFLLGNKSILDNVWHLRWAGRVG